MTDGFTEGTSGEIDGELDSVGEPDTAGEGVCIGILPPPPPPPLLPEPGDGLTDGVIAGDDVIPGIGSSVGEGLPPLPGSLSYSLDTIAAL